MPRLLTAVCLMGAVSAVSENARADRVVLVGGTVIDGRTTTKNGKVTIQTESGDVTVPADSVSRIEKSEPVASRFEARYAALPPGDVHARLDLAEFCRTHDMHAQERKLLYEVIEIDKDNEAARARLGFVKTDAGWVTRDDAMRARGYVRDEGHWVNRADYVELERLRLEKEALAQQREAAEANRHQKAIDESIRQGRLDEERSHLQIPDYPAIFFPFYRTPVVPAFVAPGFVAPFRRRLALPVQAPQRFDSTDLSVVKVPYRRH